MMSTTQLYFNLLPSDLCAASNFRHAFIWLASIELILSSASAGLSLTLSIAIYTHQKFIRFHTSFHPFLQASVFLTFSVALLFKVFSLAGLTLAILLNDGEIFITSAQEEIDELMNSDEYKFFNHTDAPIYNTEEQSAFQRGLIMSDQMTLMPGPYSCGTNQKCLYRAASNLALKRAGSISSSKPPIAIALRGSPPQDLYCNPTEVARRCFSRRQACLHRLRHIMAVYPVLQLLFGIASTAFWFSSDGIHPDAVMKVFYLSQLPSLRLFSSYLALWAIGLVSIMFFLLIATWHYARVDWQMQVLAVHHVLNLSQQHHHYGDGFDEDDEFRLRKRKVEKVQQCPSCRKKEHSRKEKQKERIRDSYSLRKAVKKEEKILARQERKMERYTSVTSLNQTSKEVKRSSWDDVQQHRDHALSSLLRNSSKEKSNKPAADKSNLLDIPGKGDRNKSPCNVPVSPTGLSIVMSGSLAVVPAGTTESVGSVERRASTTFSSDHSYFHQSPDGPTIVRTHTFDIDDIEGARWSAGIPVQKPPNRPLSVIVASSNTFQQDEKVIRPRPKSILQADSRPISTRKQKRVTFPAVIVGTMAENDGIKNRENNDLPTQNIQGGTHNFIQHVQPPAKAVLP